VTTAVVPVFDALPGGPRVRAWRAARWAAFVAPSARAAAFRHTPLRALLDVEHPANPAFYASPRPDALTLVDGRLAGRPALPPGVTVTDLGDGLDADVVPGASAPGLHDALDPWADAWLAGGLALTVTGDVAIDLDLLGAAADGVRSSRVSVAVAPGARLVLLERGVAGGGGSQVVRTDVELGAGAVVEHLIVGSPAPTTLRTVDVRVGDGADYALTSVASGGSWSRLGADVRLVGAGARARVATVALVTTGQHVDHTVRAHHVAPGGASEEVGRAVASGGGRAVWASRAVVGDGARGADVRQEARGMLLDGASRVTQDPQLEIHVDEVRASHGATVGRLDPEALFFLRARGIPLALARRELTQAFVTTAVDALRDERLRDVAAEAVRERLVAVVEGAR
jgi:Fe-S cluster assembly protein SufD